MSDQERVEHLDACDAELLAEFVATHWDAFTAHVASYRAPANPGGDTASAILNRAPYSSTGDPDLDAALFILSRLKTIAELGPK